MQRALHPASVYVHPSDRRGSLLFAAAARMRLSLQQGNLAETKLLLRFFFGLASSHVLKLAPVIAVVKHLLQMANDLPQTTAEHVAHTAMSSLPWLSVKMYEAHHAALVEVLDCPNTSPDEETSLLLAASQPFVGPLAWGGPLGGGPPAPVGLVEFSLLRQMLKFSFRGEEEKKESAVGVYRLLVSLVGRHKSKGPLVPPQKFQVEENSEESETLKRNLWRLALGLG
ncbi:hypothetical protein ETH_00033890 [Eimeria tenella]|uniref:Uncharacterized protein n=1 Tax=Eimeria tenella TaxID=5802 RepID=U6KWC9_EIMTE|nr:hypothetical protein ETH_00033890 [Eimeria tenella]CDJ41233.1 hypothetical protein ETH_00033890 [Eimeria tenella]|eukprot:XP_013231983.1 hypothetical protein ETH_00033890 [Eimeria tenella]